MEKAQAIENLKRRLPRGTTIFTIKLSGTSERRVYGYFIIEQADGKPMLSNISGIIGVAIGRKWDDKLGGLKVRNSATDMVEELIAVLFGEYRTLSPETLQCHAM